MLAQRIETLDVVVTRIARPNNTGNCYTPTTKFSDSACSYQCDPIDLLSESTTQPILRPTSRLANNGPAIFRPASRLPSPGFVLSGRPCILQKRKKSSFALRLALHLRQTLVQGTLQSAALEKFAYKLICQGIDSLFTH